MHIPQKSFFTLYAQGKKTGMVTIPGLGSYISFNGVVILFYTYPHYRRAYIVRSAAALRYSRFVSLPNVKQIVGILYRARGRSIDILKRVIFWLVEVYGEEVFLWPPVFWQKLSCCVDGARRTPAMISKRNITILCEIYDKSKRGGIYDKSKQRNTRILER